MELEVVEVTNVKYEGCPVGCRNIVFTSPNGAEFGRLIRVPPEWALSLFVEVKHHRYFMVAVSPDKNSVHVERGLPGHLPSILKATTRIEQRKLFGGLDAGRSTAAELVSAVAPALTEKDEPKTIPPRGMDLVTIQKGRDFTFTTIQETPRIATIQCTYRGPLSGYSLKTKCEEGQLVAAFRHADGRSAYFLFARGSTYILETLEFWGGRFRRREASEAKATFRRKSVQDVVKAMEPSLIQDAR